MRRNAMHIRWLPMLLIASLRVRAETQPPTHALFDVTFGEPSAAWSAPSGRLENGHLVLTSNTGKLYDGVQLTFTPTLTLPPAGQGGLRLRFTVAGVRSPAGGYIARFFLLPQRLELGKWVDPYGMPHALTLALSGSDGQATLSLYSRNGPEMQAPGRLLFSGTVAPAEFPLSLDLFVDRESYRLRCGDEVATEKGARSGPHGLVDSIWADVVGCGIRLINATPGNQPELRLAAAGAAIELTTELAPPVAGATVSPDRRPIEAVTQVHPRIVRSSGGYDQVQALFGGNVNGESRGNADALIRELHLNTSRLHLWPDIFGAPPDKQSPLTPSFAAQFGNWMGRKPLTAEETGPAWDRWFQQDFTAFLEPVVSNGIYGSHAPMPFQLALQQRWEATNNIVFFVTPRFDSNAVRHPDATARYIAQYLDTVAKHAPWIESTFAQLSNEPNYGWWTGSFAKDEDPVAGWISLFNGVDTLLAKTHPKTRLLGPCLASCAFFSWGDWNKWTVPVLRDAVRDIEDYNYHNYDTAAQSHLAWVEMLQAQAETLGRKRPRAVVTEMNDGANIGKAERKFEWWSEQLFMALDNPDKFRLLSYFLLVSREGGVGNVVAMRNGVCTPTDTYWLLWALRETRGSMRYVEPLDNPDLKVFACAPRDDRLVVSVLNGTGRPAKLTLRSGLPADAKIAGLLRWSAHRQADIVWHAEDVLDPVADVEADLSPGAVQSFVWTLAEPVLKSGPTVGQQEFFAHKVNQKFADSLETSVDVPRLPTDRETVVLRFAMASDDLLAARGLTVGVGGYADSVLWTEAPRELERGPRSTWWIELPVPRARIARSNAVSFTGADTEYRFMFASLVYREHPTSAAADAVETAVLKRRRGGVAVSFPPLGAMLADDEKPFVLTVENRREQPISCTVNLTAPSALSVSGVPAGAAVLLPAKGRQELRGTVRAERSERIQFLHLAATVETDGGDVVTCPAAVSLYPRRTAAHVAAPPVLDGTLGEWSGDATRIASGSGPLQFRAAWDAKNLYLAIDVKTGKRPVQASDPRRFWEGDVMEVFLDLRNAKTPLYDAGCGQFYFCPYSGGSDGILASGYCRRERKGDQVVHAGTVTDGPWRSASQSRDDGYVLECAVPWSVLDAEFAPQPGMRIGMDVAVRGFVSAFGTEGKPYDSPRLWGILDLE